jgi:hypothetical protein
VDHAHLLVVLDRQKELPHIVCSLSLVKKLVGLLDDPVEHGLPLDLLHDQVDVLFVLVVFEVLHDVGVVHAR